MWLAANSNDDGLQPRSSTATLCMRKADRSITSHTTNSSGEYAERKQPVIKGVLLSVADCQRDAGASVLEILRRGGTTERCGVRSCVLCGGRFD